MAREFSSGGSSRLSQTLLGGHTLVAIDAATLPRAQSVAGGDYHRVLLTDGRHGELVRVTGAQSGFLHATGREDSGSARVWRAGAVVAGAAADRHLFAEFIGATSDMWCPCSQWSATWSDASLAPTVSEVTTEIERIASTYGGVSIETLALSTSLQAVLGLWINDDGQRSPIVVTAGNNGQYPGPALAALRFAELMASRDDTVSREMSQAFSILVVPAANPDAWVDSSQYTPASIDVSRCYPWHWDDEPSTRKGSAPLVAPEAAGIASFTSLHRIEKLAGWLTLEVGSSAFAVTSEQFFNLCFPYTSPGTTARGREGMFTRFAKNIAGLWDVWSGDVYEHSEYKSASPWAWAGGQTRAQDALVAGVEIPDGLTPAAQAGAALDLVRAFCQSVLPSARRQPVTLRGGMPPQAVLNGNFELSSWDATSACPTLHEVASGASCALVNCGGLDQALRLYTSSLGADGYGVFRAVQTFSSGQYDAVSLAVRLRHGGPELSSRAAYAQLVVERIEATSPYYHSTPRFRVPTSEWGLYVLPSAIRLQAGGTLQPELRIWAGSESVDVQHFAFARGSPCMPAIPTNINLGTVYQTWSLDGLTDARSNDVSQYQQYILSVYSPDVFYPLDDSVPGLARNIGYLGESYNGALTGSAYQLTDGLRVAFQGDYAVEFDNDSTTAYARMSTNSGYSALVGNSDSTTCFAFRVETVYNQNFNSIVGQYPDGISGNRQTIGVTRPSSGSRFILWDINNGERVGLDATSATIHAGSIYHAVVTKKYLASQSAHYAIYLNGLLVASEQHFPTPYGEAHLVIAHLSGDSATLGSRGWCTVADLFQLRLRELSPADVTSIYTAWSVGGGLGALVSQKQTMRALVRPSVIDGFVTSGDLFRLSTSGRNVDSYYIGLHWVGSDAGAAQAIPAGTLYANWSLPAGAGSETLGQYPLGVVRYSGSDSYLRRDLLGVTLTRTDSGILLNAGHGGQVGSAELLLSGYWIDGAITSWGAALWWEDEVGLPPARGEGYFGTNSEAPLQVNPEFDYEFGRERPREGGRTRDGSRYAYDLGAYRSQRFSLRLVSSSTALAITSLWADARTVAFGWVGEPAPPPMRFADDAAPMTTADEPGSNNLWSGVIDLEEF